MKNSGATLSPLGHAFDWIGYSVVFASFTSSMLEEYKLKVSFSHTLALNGRFGGIRGQVTSPSFHFGKLKRIQCTRHPHGQVPF
jgi:hypothetical protein